MISSEISPVRYAAKGVLLDSENRILLLRGMKTRRLSLVGGGLKVRYNEQVTDGFDREVTEETGLLPEDIAGLKPVGFVEGDVDDGRTAFWYLYRGNIVDDHTPITLGADIESMEFMTAQEFLDYDGLKSKLAHDVIKQMHF